MNYNSCRLPIFYCRQKEKFKCLKCGSRPVVCIGVIVVDNDRKYAGTGIWKMFILVLVLKYLKKVYKKSRYSKIVYNIFIIIKKSKKINSILRDEKKKIRARDFIHEYLRSL